MAGAVEAMHMMTRDRRRHFIVCKAGGTHAGIVALGGLVASLLEDAQLVAGVQRDLARSYRLALPG